MAICARRTTERRRGSPRSRSAWSAQLVLGATAIGSGQRKREGRNISRVQRRGGVVPYPGCPKGAAGFDGRLARALALSVAPPAAPVCSKGHAFAAAQSDIFCLCLIGTPSRAYVRRPGCSVPSSVLNALQILIDKKMRCFVGDI